jgi:hypothetical protein
MKRLTLVLAICLITMLPIRAHAAAWCSGTLRDSFVRATGELLVFPRWRNDFIQLCSTTTIWKGVSTTTCLLWASMATLAVRQQNQTTTYYDDPVASTGCPTIPFYDLSPAPGYFMFSNP